MKNFWTAQLYFSGFVVWAFGAILGVEYHHLGHAAVSAIISLVYLAFGIYTIRKPDKPDPPTRGTGGFAAA